jgi:hypothetical protein
VSDAYDFDEILAAKLEEAGTGPSYKLLGTTWKCLALAPAHTLRSLIAEENSVEGTFQYLIELLVPEQREEFAEKVLVSDVVDLDILSQVVTFLTEKYNGRPFEPASPSPSA